MPSLISTLLREQIRLLKPIITGFSISTSRNLQEKLGELGAKALAGKVSFSDFEIGHIPASIAEPCEEIENPEHIVLYIHGGGYVAGEIGYARGFAGLLASKIDMRVMCIAYRLAPENPYPAALEDSLAAYEYLLENGYSPDNISLIGESAGGGLILAMCCALKERGLPLPSRLIPISPWTDLTLSGESYAENVKADVCLSMKEIEGFIEAVAPPDLRDPLVSPLFGDVSGFPPCLIYVGGDELLKDDSVKMAERLKDAGVPCRLKVEDGMWHAYVLYGVPEANEALCEIRIFLEDNMPEKVLSR